MGPGAALFDTNILIDFLKKIPAAELELGRYEQRYISQITWIEVMAGAKPGDELDIRGFLEAFQSLGLTKEVAEQTIMLRRQQRLKLPDAVILATAVTNGLTLVTRNSRDFTEGPMVRIPYQS